MLSSFRVLGKKPLIRKKEVKCSYERFLSILRKVENLKEVRTFKKVKRRALRMEKWMEAI